MSILCPAQGYPAPSFRYSCFQSKNHSMISANFQCFRFLFHWKTILISRTDFVNVTKAFCHRRSTFVGSARSINLASMPRSRLSRTCIQVSDGLSSRKLLKYLWSNFSVFLSLSLWILKFEIIYSEPISSTPPKLSLFDTRPMSVLNGGSISILCPAQGYPAPAFR